jgi:hypothetical protein
MLSIRRRSCVIDSSIDMGASGGGGVGGSGGWNGGIGRPACVWTCSVGTASIALALGTSGCGGRGKEAAGCGGATTGFTKNGGSGSWFGSGDDWKADQAHLPSAESSFLLLAALPLWSLAPLPRLFLPPPDEPLAEESDPLPLFPLAPSGPVTCTCCLPCDRELGVADRPFACLDPRFVELLRVGAPFPTNTVNSHDRCQQPG